MDVDPYDEEIWEDPNFLYWLKKKTYNQSTVYPFKGA
jgi:hypothetical protein